MPLPTLLLPPDQASYAVADGHTVIATQLDGGAGRYRSDVINASFRVTVQWTCDAHNFNYLKAFFRTSTNFGALPFIVGLYADSGGIQNYTAYFVPDTFGLISQAGQTFVVGATLEALFDPSYMSGDAATIAGGID